jgi:hypothetical protein
MTVGPRARWHRASRYDDFGSFFGNTPVTGVVYDDRNTNGNLLEQGFEVAVVKDATASRFTSMSRSGWRT